MTLAMNGSSASPLCLSLAQHQFAAAAPGAHDVNTTGAQHQRQPAAMLDLVGIGAEERNVDDQEQPADAINTRHSSSATCVRNTNMTRIESIVIVPTTAMP